MHLALDIDGNIDEHPEFFSLLSAALRANGHRVTIVACRDPGRMEHTIGQLRDWGIDYDGVVIARSLEDKGRLCRELDIDIFFDDQDECIVPVDERTQVFKIRNGGNFDYDEKKWISTGKLTRLL